MPTVLVTGGAGYIGTHLLVELVRAGYGCVCVDNYSNSAPAAVEQARGIAGSDVTAYDADIRDRAALDRILARHPIDGVIHLAGLKAVDESVREPQRYRDNNVEGTRVLLEALQSTRTRDFVFSSSATVYGNPAKVPVPEDAPTAPANPYGQTKLEVERLLAERARSDPAWRVTSLRYFNPVGAHPSGAIGEDPLGPPANLMPAICQVAAGRLEELQVFGGDYPTPDGTGVRDFIHVMDLAAGHVAALRAMDASPRGSVSTINLGAGRGCSVLELVHAFERANGVAVRHRIAGRREGDIATCYADTGRARRELNWHAIRSVEEMCRDAWRWQSTHPRGYR